MGVDDDGNCIGNSKKSPPLIFMLKDTELWAKAEKGFGPSVGDGCPGPDEATQTKEREKMTAKINEEAMAEAYQEQGIQEKTAKEMAKDLAQSVKQSRVWDSMLDSVFGLDRMPR